VDLGLIVLGEAALAGIVLVHLNEGRAFPVAVPGEVGVTRVEEP
jgi:hypothetical protein